MRAIAAGCRPARRAIGLLAAIAAVLAAVPASAGALERGLELVSTGPSAGPPSDATFVGASTDGTRVFLGTRERLSGADGDDQFDLYERSGGVTTLLTIGSAGGNGAFPAFFAGASADGSRVFFGTSEALEPGDTDTSIDLYERASGETRRLSTGPSGGNGAAPAPFSGASADGSRVFFFTSEALVAGDTDGTLDIYERSGDQTVQVTTGAVGGNGPFPAFFSDVSSAGDRVVFFTREALVAEDTDAAQDLYQRSGGQTVLLSTGPAGGNGGLDAVFAGASEDGARVFFHTTEPLVAGDADAQQDVYERAGGQTSLVSVGPDGGNGAFDASFAGSSADGTHVFFHTDESLVAADTDAARDVYGREGAATTLVSTDGGAPTADPAAFQDASDDGARVLFSTREQLAASDGDDAIDVYERAGAATTLISTGPAAADQNIDVSPPSDVEGRLAISSSDGARVFFFTTEELVFGDFDGFIDIYERSGGVTTLVTPSRGGGVNSAFDARFRGMSSDGTQVFLETFERLVAEDSDNEQDVFAARPVSAPPPAGGPAPAAAAPAPPAPRPAATCRSKRRFRIRISVPRRTRVRSVRVRMRGRNVPVRKLRSRGRLRYTATIDLRGLPPTRVTVRITVRKRSGRPLRQTRRYRTCVAARAS